MIAGESLALYGEAVAVGTELCDDLLQVASGDGGFAENWRGQLSVKASWSFDAAGQAVTITKRGTSFGDYENQHSLSASGGTRIVISGDDIRGLDHVFDTRVMPPQLSQVIRVEGPSDFSKGYDGKAPVGKTGLTLGTLLSWAVGLDAGEFDEALSRYEPEATSSTVCSAHFGDTVEGLGAFSVTAVLRDALLEDGRQVVSRAFTLLLPSGDSEDYDGRLTFETFAPTVTYAGFQPISEEPLLSIRGSLFGKSADRKRDLAQQRGEAPIPQTYSELGEIREIGRKCIKYVAGYTGGYAERFKPVLSTVHPDELYALGYEAGRQLRTPARRSPRYAYEFTGAYELENVRLQKF